MKLACKNIKRPSLWLLLTAAIMAPGLVHGQNVYKDYVRDSNAQYSPCDHQQRGLVYRTQTGHAGFFGNCDDDRLKMNSPYIDWHCRMADCRLPAQFVSEMFGDFFRKNQRLTDGAGACVWGRCGRCDQQSGDCQCGETQIDQSHLGQRTVSNSQKVNSQKAESRYAEQQRSLSSQSVQFATRRNDPRHQQSTASAAQRTAFNRQSLTYRGDAAKSNSPSREMAYAAPRQNQRYSSIYDRQRQTNGSIGLASRSSDQQTNASNSYFAESDEASSRNRASVSQTTYRQPESTSQKSLDPRFRTGEKLVPENRFERFEKRNQQQRPATQSRNSPSSTFRLSSGRVFPVPSATTAASRSAQNPDQQSSPQYFQFQRIGGSENR